LADVLVIQNCQEGRERQPGFRKPAQQLWTEGRWANARGTSREGREGEIEERNLLLSGVRKKEALVNIGGQLICKTWRDMKTAVGKEATDLKEWGKRDEKKRR